MEKKKEGKCERCGKDISMFSFSIYSCPVGYGCSEKYVKYVGKMP